MVNIFTFLKDILYKKRGNLLQNCNDESQFQPYMMCRWISMYSPGMSKLINQTFNRIWQAFDDKQMWYKSLILVIPQTRFKKINYIKKNIEKKKINPERIEIINQLAHSNEISKREMEEIIKEHNIDIAKYVRAIK